MVDIRAASKPDLALVQHLAHRIWHAHYPGIIAVAQIDYMLANGYALAALESFLTSTGAGLALAWVDAQPVGYSAWLRSPEPATTKLDKL